MSERLFDQPSNWPVARLRKYYMGVYSLMMDVELFLLKRGNPWVFSSFLHNVCW